MHRSTSPSHAGSPDPGSPDPGSPDPVFPAFVYILQIKIKIKNTTTSTDYIDYESAFTPPHG
jgi:hypothetical protein